MPFSFCLACQINPPNCRNMNWVCFIWSINCKKAHPIFLVGGWGGQITFVVVFLICIVFVSVTLFVNMENGHYHNLLYVHDCYVLFFCQKSGLHILQISNKFLCFCACFCVSYLSFLTKYLISFPKIIYCLTLYRTFKQQSTDCKLFGSVNLNSFPFWKKGLGIIIF